MTHPYQDREDGGVSDRPGNMADIFHTFFGIGGLSLIGWFDEEKRRGQYPGFEKIDPVYALPSRLVEKLRLKAQLL